MAVASTDEESVLDGMVVIDTVEKDMVAVSCSGAAQERAVIADGISVCREQSHTQTPSIRCTMGLFDPKQSAEASHVPHGTTLVMEAKTVGMLVSVYVVANVPER